MNSALEFCIVFSKAQDHPPSPPPPGPPACSPCREMGWIEMALALAVIQ